jgi:hypothetical protein
VSSKRERRRRRRRMKEEEEEKEERYLAAYRNDDIYSNEEDFQRSSPICKLNVSLPSVLMRPRKRMYTVSLLPWKLNFQKGKKYVDEFEAVSRHKLKNVTGG